MKKKLLATMLVAAMALSTVLTGCGSSSSSGSSTSSDSSAAASEATSEAATSEAASSWVPEKTINWMCTSSAGGGSDIFTREISDIMTTEDMVNGQTIVVTNKTDGSGEIGRNEVATMTKDADYQLLTFNSGDLTPMVTNTKNRSSNFRILAIMAVDKQLIFKTEQTKYDDFASVIAACEAGEKIIIGGSKGDDVATYNALIAELGISEENLTYITYDSTGDAITAALGGHVDLLISKPAAASQYVEAGDLTAILALSTERYTGNLADAPTLSEVGDYEDVEVPIWRGVAAPAAMSDEAAAFWSDLLGQVSETDAWTNDYITPNQLISQHMDTTEATEYVTNYEKDYMETNGIQ